MFTKKEQRIACISLASMLENLTDSFYIDVTTVYSDITIHCDKFSEMREVNRFLNHLQPYELEKKFAWRHDSDGNKFYTIRLKIVDFKKK